MEKSFPLDELIDLEELQSIQDSFANAAGISSVIFLAKDKPLTRFTNPTGFCSLIQSTEKGKERCFRSFLKMEKIALESEKPEICYCFAHGGHFVAPIKINGEHKGTMFAGQFIPEKFSPEQLQNLEEIAQEIDLDPGLLVKEAGKMRIVGEGVIRNHSSRLFKVVEILAKRCMQAAELSRVNDALKVAYDELERRVQERTAELAEANEGLRYEITERKKAEKTLRKSEERMKTMFEEAPLGIALIDSLTAHIYEVNPKFAEIAGRSREEMARINWISITHPDDVQEDLDNMALLNAGKITGFNMNKRYIQPDGSLVWINMTIALIKVEDKTQPRHLCMIEDITERKQVEETLRKSEEKFRLLSENSIDCIWMVNTMLRFTYLSPSVEKMMGFKPEQWVGTTLSSHFKKKEFLKAGFLAAKAIKNYKTFTHVTFETKMLNSKNEEVDVEISSKVLLNSQDKLIGLQGITRDITDRKATQEEIRKSEERYKTLFEFAMDGILIADIETKRFKYANPALCKMLGYSPEELKGMSVSDIHPKDNFEHVISEFEAQARGEKTLAQYIPCLRKDGTIIYADINTTVALVDEKKCNIGFFRDITERKAAEEEIKEKADELEKFNRLAVGREFKMIELKKEINALLEKLGKEPGYKIVGDV